MIDACPLSLYSVRVLKIGNPKLRKPEPCRVEKLKRSRYQDEPESPGITRGLQAFPFVPRKIGMQAPFFIGLVGNTTMHKPTPSRVKSQLESACTPSMRFPEKNARSITTESDFGTSIGKSRQHTFHFLKSNAKKRREKQRLAFAKWKVLSTPKNQTSGKCKQPKKQGPIHPWVLRAWKVVIPIELQSHLLCKFFIKRANQEFVPQMAARTHGWSARLTLARLHPWACPAIRGFHVSWIVRTLAHAERKAGHSNVHQPIKQPVG